MTPFEAYREYIALRAHFNSTYDYHKYNGKSSVTQSSFDVRRDKLFFAKLAKHQDPRGLLISTFLEDPKAWIRDISYSPTAESRRVAWVKKVQALSYNLKSEMREYWSEKTPPYPSIFEASAGSHPIALREYLGGRFSLETLIILIDIGNCMEYWNRDMPNDPVWKEVRTKIAKYKPFITYDSEKIKSDWYKTTGFSQ
jgi:hypothetical protein